MKTYNQILFETSANDLKSHVDNLSRKLKLKGPIKSDQKRLVYETTLSQQKVFDVLHQKGYKKGKGYDPKPDSWNTSTDRESMITRSDRIFYGKPGSFIMASIEAEHGDKLRVIFEKQ